MASISLYELINGICCRKPLCLIHLKQKRLIYLPTVENYFVSDVEMIDSVKLIVVWCRKGYTVSPNKGTLRNT